MWRACGHVPMQRSTVQKHGGYMRCTAGTLAYTYTYLRRERGRGGRL